MIEELGIRLAGELTKRGGLPVVKMLEGGLSQDAPPVEDFSVFGEALPWILTFALGGVVVNLVNQTAWQGRELREWRKTEMFWAGVMGGFAGMALGLVPASR
jgi:hypothetical protein